MMKTLILLIFLFISCPAGATTYYVGPTGSDLNAGTSSDAPFLHPTRATLALSASDTLTFLGTATAPSRGTITSAANNVTYTAASKYGYISAGHDVSHNGIAEDPNNKDWMESWAAANNLNSWTESGTVSQESTTIANGLYAAKMVGDGSYIRKTYTLNTGNSYRWHVIYKVDAPGTLFFRLRNTSSTNYLKSDGTWAASPAGFTAGSSTSYAEYVTPWAVGETTGAHYRLDLNCYGAGNLYVDGVWVEEKFAWVAHDAPTGVYKTNCNLLNPITSFWKSTSWTGPNSLVSCAPSASLAAIATGEFFHDGTTLYYRLATGETDITALHFEAEGGTGTFSITHTGNVLSNIASFTSRTSVSITGSATISNCLITKSLNRGITTTSSGSASVSDTEISYLKTYGVQHGDGIVPVDSSTITATRCYVHDVDDDCLNPDNSANLTVSYSLMDQTGAGSAIEVSNATAGTITLYNNVLRKSGATGEGVIRDKGGVNVNSIYKNNIVIQNDATGASVVIDTPDRSGGTGSITSETNYHWGTGSNQATAPAIYGSGSTNVNPKMSGFRPLASSPCKNTATDIWTGTNNVTDFEGIAVTNGSGVLVAPGGLNIGAYEILAPDTGAAMLLGF